MTRPTATRRAGPGLAAVLVLAALAAPSVAHATEPVPAVPPADETPTVVPHSTEAPTDGEIVYDGPFIEPEPDGSQEADPDPAAPGADVDGPARPPVTPPATDAPGDPAPAAPGGGLPLLLLPLATAAAAGLRAAHVRR